MQIDNFNPSPIKEAHVTSQANSLNNTWVDSRDRELWIKFCEMGSVEHICKLAVAVQDEFRRPAWLD